MVSIKTSSKTRETLDKIVKTKLRKRWSKLIKALEEDPKTAHETRENLEKIVEGGTFNENLDKNDESESQFPSLISSK